MESHLSQEYLPTCECNKLDRNMNLALLFLILCENESNISDWNMNLAHQYHFLYQWLLCYTHNHLLHTHTHFLTASLPIYKKIPNKKSHKWCQQMETEKNLIYASINFVNVFLDYRQSKLLREIFIFSLLAF